MRSRLLWHTIRPYWETSLLYAVYCKKKKERHFDGFRLLRSPFKNKVIVLSIVACSRSLKGRTARNKSCFRCNNDPILSSSSLSKKKEASGVLLQKEVIGQIIPVRPRTVHFYLRSRYDKRQQNNTM